MFNVFLFFLMALSFAFCPNLALAQDASEIKEKSAAETNTYETPTVAKLSRLYWALGKFDNEPDPKQYIDNYLRINECEVYKNFSHNEFDWLNIKDATYDFLRKNKQNFPKHFALI